MKPGVTSKAFTDQSALCELFQMGLGEGGKEAGWDKPSSAPTLSSPAKAHESGKLFQQLQVSEERNRPEMWKEGGGPAALSS